MTTCQKILENCLKQRVLLCEIRNSTPGKRERDNLFLKLQNCKQYFGGVYLKKSEPILLTSSAGGNAKDRTLFLSVLVPTSKFGVGARQKAEAKSLPRS